MIEVCGRLPIYFYRFFFIRAVLAIKRTIDDFLDLFISDIGFEGVLLIYGCLLENYQFSLGLIIVYHIIDTQKWLLRCSLWAFLI